MKLDPESQLQAELDTVKGRYADLLRALHTVADKVGLDIQDVRDHHPSVLAVLITERFNEQKVLAENEALRANVKELEAAFATGSSYVEVIVPQDVPSEILNLFRQKVEAQPDSNGVPTVKLFNLGAAEGPVFVVHAGRDAWEFEGDTASATDDGWEPSNEELEAITRLMQEAVEGVLPKDKPFSVITLRHDVKVEAVHVKKP